MINFFHSGLIRLANKIKKIRKRDSWDKTPHLSNAVFFDESFQLFDPHLVGTKTLANESISNETIIGVLDILNKFESEPCIDFVKKYISTGLNNFGDKWIYADINTVLFAISKNLKIDNYLEIGVRRGRSMGVVCSQAKNVNVYAFDIWIENYTGVENPGPDFVKSEISKVGHSGNITFVNGDSKKTIPDFFQKNPNIFFDLITVDGDHSLKGAKVDLRNVIKKLKVGGILVFDDIASHEHPYLYDVWKKEIKSKERFYTWEYTDNGLGVAFAIRKY
jgi:predicted O-methyltransferase YrrM